MSSKPIPESPSADAGTTIESKTDVGYGKPPIKSRFVKGKSGNPKGRPRGSARQRRNLIELLGEEVSIQEGGRIRKITKYEVINTRLIHAAMKGDLKAIAKVLSMVAPSDMAAATQSEIERKRPVTAEEASKAYREFIAIGRRARGV